MAIEVKVVQDPGNNFIWSMITQDGNSPLWWDKILKGAIAIKTVADFVRICVETKASQGLIDYIQINGHGNSTGFRLGNERIDLVSINNFQPILATVTPLLNRTCYVEISACQAGKAIEVVRKFSSILGGVTIIGYILPQTGGWQPSGQPVVITPGGSYIAPAPATGGNSIPLDSPPPR